MTKKVHSLVMLTLTTGMIIDPATQTAYDVYDNILRMASPLDNQAGCLDIISDNTLKMFLTSFDYRSDSFQSDVINFCEHMSLIMKEFARSGDKQLIAVAAVLLYIKGTDIEQKACNILINDIINLSPDSCTITSQINTMTAMLSSNVVGQQSLDLDTKSQTNDVISAFGNLLGAECISRSSARNAAVPERYMRSMQEWGIDVSKFLKMNQRVINGEQISSSEVIELINLLQLDTSAIDFEGFTPTIYDIMNIRFCWSFRWIFQWILMTPSEETGKTILNTVTGCLLATDKNFIELDYSYLTLVEIVVNCLYAMINGLVDGGYDLGQKRYAYYAYIRAKKLVSNPQPNGLLDVSLISDQGKLHTVYREVQGIQQKILSSLKGLGFVEPLDEDREKQSLMESLAQTIQSVESGESSTPSYFGNVVSTNFCESNATIQLFDTMGQLEKADQTKEVRDVKKLLSEVAGLSTTLCYGLEEGLTILPWLVKQQCDKL